MKDPISRRHFLETASLAGAGLTLALPQLGGSARGADAVAGKPAKLGGKPVCSGGWPGWPVYGEPEEQSLLGTLKSGHWYRGTGKAVSGFEAAYEKLTGAKHCLATASGTAALSTALGALDVGPGDEVIIPPYTFVATYNVVVLNYALPVFVDSDLESFQIDADKIDAAVTKNTRVIMPVHLGGYPADLDKILEVASKHQVTVVEDACQAHLAEWRGRKVGTWGMAGCFSFQASKNLNSGEGGAVLTNDDQFAETCYNFHNQGRARQVSGYNFSYSGTRGSNLRLCEFQGGLLTAQMTRVIEQSNRRHENALYLTKLLGEIPGIKPAKLHPHATRSAYHLYMFRYDPAQFAGLSRAKFLAALSAEGVPASSGYGVMNKDAYVSALAKNKHFLKLYGEKRLKEWLDRNQNLPENDKLCEQAVWLTQTITLAEREKMDQIAEAIRKIRRYAAELAKA
ncbi:MAG: DegT/DnrJ/EryC1/StrS family aminotransferase [Verrucomicrobia bacterium]|nr:DegT/DnrJ/EryC1/StrS family aminotransferase [Verrucomicrobiota bacterium]